MLGISIFLTNCQKDDDQFQTSKETQTNSNIKISTLRKTEIEKDKRLIRKLSKLKTDIKAKNNGALNNRDVYNAEYDFTINTDYAKHIDNGINHTYTFPIYREQDNGLLENLLLVEQGNDTFKAYIVQYEFTEQEITAINFRQQVDIENKVSFIEINDNGFSDDIFGKYYYNGSCYEDNYVYQQGNDCLSGQHTFADGNECDYWGTINMATTGGYVNIPTLISCDSGGGGSTNTGNTNPPSGNTNNNPHGGGGTSGSSTTPITCRTCPELENPIDINQQTPCEKIATQITNPLFDDKVDIVNSSTAFNASQETGFSQKTNGAFNVLSATNGGHSLSIPITSTMVGFIHSHINGYEVPDKNGDGVPEEETPIKMLSPGDIITFLQLLENANTNNIPLIDVYGSMYSSASNYTIKFTGNIADVLTNLNNLETLRNNQTLNKKYVKYFEKYSNKEKALLHFLKNEIGINGIRLFKIKNNGTIKEKFLKDNGNVDSETC